MPSKSVLETKQAIVAQLKDKVANSVSGVVVDYKGITAEADTKLRKELREAGVEYTVVKNTLLKRAIEGTEIEGMSEVLEGTTALAVSHEDQIAPARIAAIADLPSKEGLVQMLLSVLVSGPRGLAIALSEVAKAQETA